MIRVRREVRIVALAAALLLLWCHGLDAPLHAGAGAALPHAAGASVTAVAAPALPAHPAPRLNCCVGTGESGPLPIVTARLPSMAAPLLAALLSVPLLLAALRPLRPAPQRLAPHRASLVAQSVLIRI